MTRCFLILCIFLFVTDNFYGQEIVVKPYLQDVTQYEIKVMWETNSIGSGKIIWGESPFDLVNEVISTSIVGSGNSRIHIANLSSLDPKSKYYYKVQMSGGQTSTLYNYRTLAITMDEMNTQFMAISDMQRDGSHPNKFNEIIEEGIIPTFLLESGGSISDLEGVLIPGDLVVTGGNYSQWREHFFSQADSLFSYVPVYPVLGNHEYSGTGGEDNFKKYFSLPENGASTLLEECYYKDISNVRIIGLNSNSGTTDKNIQLDWLSGILDSTCANPDIDFVFAQLHHPHKSELWTPGESNFTGQVIDSLEVFTSVCNKASLHFFGHTHGYSRGQSRDHKHLWVNVATAGGAIDNWGEFPNADYDEFVKSQDEYGFVYIDVKAGKDPMFTLKRFGRGDQDNIVDNELRDEISIFNASLAPSRPTNIFPVSDTLPSSCVKLKGSQFSGIEDTHQGTHWQLSTDSLFDTQIVKEEWKQNENFYNEINTQANDDLTDIEIDEGLSGGEYYWRVRYRNQSLDWSNWSQYTSFLIENSGDTITANLISNPGAENGIVDWIGDIESLTNAECGSVPAYEGNSNFGVGGICTNESPLGIASQTIDLSDYSDQISQDKLSIALSGYMRNFNGSDIPEMYLELYENNNLITTSPVITNPTPEWINKSFIIDLPEITDEVKVILKGTRNTGTDNDSYFDNLSLYLLDNILECVSCFGKSNIDFDGDGFCSDKDCNDNDDAIYPGAIETCNNIDDNCDGLPDLGNTVNWIGTGNSNLWSKPTNWDQNIVPLSCQHVVIDDNATVIVDGDFDCYSLEIATNNNLNVPNSNSITINSQNTNSVPSVKILGTMTIDGLCDIKKSQGIGFEVFGTLINNNRLNMSMINNEMVVLKSGGIFESIGFSILKKD
ncbi:MAG: hypothetical protein ACJA1A_003916 [Saprospiraceae bacterium]|jgi:hypothetical protein